jgi:hypothetical protein
VNNGHFAAKYHDHCRKSLALSHFLRFLEVVEGDMENRQPPQLNFGEPLDFDKGANFNGTPAACRDAGGYIDGFVKVSSVDQEEAAELLASFGKGTIGDQAFAIVEAKAGGGGGGLERGGAEELAVFVKLVCEGRGFDIAVFPLLLCKCSIFIKIH